MNRSFTRSCLLLAAVSASPLLLVACAISLTGTAMAFYRGRCYYLEQPRPEARSVSDAV